MKVCVKKLSFNNNENLCIIPKSIFDKLEMSTEEPYCINFGLSKETLSITLSDTEEENIYLSENIFNSLHLIEDIKLNIWKVSNNLFLGPVVGIFVNERRMNRFKNSTGYFVKQHIRAAISENCTGYFFSAHDIDWLGNRIKGLNYIPELKSYACCWLPFPNIFYDRATNRIRKERTAVISIRNKFRSNPDIKLINSPNPLGKWSSYEALSKYPEAKEHLPETIIYTCFEDVLSMLDKNNLMFLKSFYGTQGSEVLSIEKLELKYKLNYYKRGAKELIIDSLDELRSFISKFVRNKKFIIQQGLRLLTYNGRSLDIRMFLMKNETGNWESIFKGARIAKGNFLLTNIHAGGVYGFYEQLYPKLKRQYESVNLPSPKDLDDTSIKLVSCLEKEFGPYGELGVDIGVDIHGKIWFIEANITPGKRLSPFSVDINGRRTKKVIVQLYKGSMKHKKILPQAIGIFKYAKFLTGTNEV